MPDKLSEAAVKIIAQEEIDKQVPSMIELAMIKALKPTNDKLEELITAISTKDKINETWTQWTVKIISPALISTGVILGTLKAKGII